MKYNSVEQYGFVRGFNFQPDCGSNGAGIWLNFDGKRYREQIAHAKVIFPRMNTLRIWLSFDAWCEDADTYNKSIAEAASIIEQEGLKFIPVYFNGWFGMPTFGGFVAETLGWQRESSNFAPYRAYLNDCFNAINSPALLLHDISNEPFNNVWEHRYRTEIVRDFMASMCMEMRGLSTIPITVGSQGFPTDNTMGIEEIKSKWGDIDLLSPYVDVITLHPYCCPPTTKEQHIKSLKEVVEYTSTIEKPVIITECCWAGITDEDRRPFLEIEIPHYAEIGIGFCAHALWESPVADLHTLVDSMGIGEKGLYMAFINKDGSLRKYHEIFNKY